MARVKVRIQYVGDAWDEHDITIGTLDHAVANLALGAKLDDGSVLLINWDNVRSIRFTELKDDG